MKWLFECFVIMPMFVFGPLLLVTSIAIWNPEGFMVGAIVMALSWGYLLKMSENHS